MKPYGIFVSKLSTELQPHAYGITFTQIKIPTCSCKHQMDLTAESEYALYFTCPKCYCVTGINKFAEVKTP